ncbi:MAG: mandelate racemase [Planctomycetes bacterium]|nr:mandelate racemase [Planctomycetota bacterium]
MTAIRDVTTHDIRFPLPGGSGTDAVHGDPEYSYAVTCLRTADHVGHGSAFTLGNGNDVVVSLAQRLGDRLLAIAGTDIESMMARFGEVQRQLADDSQLRWLGPHKGAVHLALASVTNATFDLWAKSRGVPLWRLLLDLDDLALVDLCDLSWIEDDLDRDAALLLLERERPLRPARTAILDTGYPGYDTSVGWFDYPDELIADNARRAVAAGFGAMKLKVGSRDLERDLRRVRIVREAAGSGVRVMVDANQQWRWPMAMRACAALAELGVYWIEEPTHPDDVLGHRRLRELVRSSGVRIAVGEHISHRVLFKNFIQAEAVDVVQVDALRVAGVSEFLAVSMLARRAGLEVVPHVGDMGQLHRHLVLWNHIALGLPATMLEHIPHLGDRFVDPARVAGGVYHTPRLPGASLALREVHG